MRTASVHLGDTRVGLLRENERGVIEFRIDEDYARSSHRPVLGQWFEDHPRGLQRGDRPGDLPPFFANLIPEGDLGLILRERLGIHPADDFGLLLAVGEDLPGALVVRLEEGAATNLEEGRVPEDESAPVVPRFSLAGVQLKFSMMRQGDRFFFPGRDGRGDWIAKVAFELYAGLCENELTTMEWARRSGFEVPDCELHRLSDLMDVPYSGDPASTIFVIRRFDRDGQRRIHQEDFQQILGRRPEKKYDDLTYEQLVLLATSIVGQDAYDESVRRLVLMVATGNADAHLKNWAVLYPDGVHARLTPLYDQVFTAQWPQFRHELALNLGGAKTFVSIEMGRFRELARRVGRDTMHTERLVVETLESIATTWQGLRDYPVTTPEYRSEIASHWQRVPLLKPYATRMARLLSDH